MIEQWETIKSIEKTFTILESVSERPKVGLSELTEDVDMPKTTVYVHLQTLEKCGYVVKEDQQYRPSLKFLYHGGKFRNQMSVFKHGREEVRILANETGELINLGVEENGRGVVIYTMQGDNAAIDLNSVGQSSYLHQAAYGKAMLAHFPDDRIHEIINQHGLPSVTEKTLTSETELFDELAKVRENGYATERDQGTIGIGCVGAPILDIDGQPRGAVSVSVPTNKLDSNSTEEELAQKLINATNVIELKMEHN